MTDWWVGCSLDVLTDQSATIDSSPVTFTDTELTQTVEVEERHKV